MTPPSPQLAGPDAVASPKAGAGRQQSKSAATQAALIAAGRSLFGTVGYHAAATNDLVAAAAVTRGALYHHFADKGDLFEAVAREVSQGLTDAASNEVLAMPLGTWARFLQGLRSYLHLVAASGEAQRILLIDGPSVLGWRRWRKLQSDIVLPGTIRGFTMLMDQGAVALRDPEPMANLILATLNDAALTIANAPDPQVAQAHVSDALTALVQGLRTEERNDDPDAA